MTEYKVEKQFLAGIFGTHAVDKLYSLCCVWLVLNLSGVSRHANWPIMASIVKRLAKFFRIKLGWDRSRWYHAFLSVKNMFTATGRQRVVTWNWRTKEKPTRLDARVVRADWGVGIYAIWGESSVGWGGLARWR